jgi:hypothetical protein
MKQSFIPHRYRLLTILTTMLLLLVCGCGGGFGEDSDNARQFRQSIFGAEVTDTTAP